MDYSTQLVGAIQVVAGAGIQWLRGQPWFKDSHQAVAIGILGVMGFLFAVNPSEVPAFSPGWLGWREPVAFVVIGLVTSFSTVMGGTFAANWASTKMTIVPKWVGPK